MKNPYLYHHQIPIYKNSTLWKYLLIIHLNIVSKYVMIKTTETHTSYYIRHEAKSLRNPLISIEHYYTNYA